MRERSQYQQDRALPLVSPHHGQADVRERGNIRFIQAMLGHANVSTTRIYTQVNIRKLKEIHAATHPARMQSNRQRQAERTDETPTLIISPKAEQDLIDI